MYQHLKLNPADLKAYMVSKWVLYASTTNWRGKRVCLEVNLDQKYRVLVDGFVQHEGTILEDAVAAFNELT